MIEWTDEKPVPDAMGEWWNGKIVEKIYTDASLKGLWFYHGIHQRVCALAIDGPWIKLDLPQPPEQPKPPDAREEIVTRFREATASVYQTATLRKILAEYEPPKRLEKSP